MHWSVLRDPHLRDPAPARPRAGLLVSTSRPMGSPVENGPTRMSRRVPGGRTVRRRAAGDAREGCHGSRATSARALTDGAHPTLRDEQVQRQQQAAGEGPLVELVRKAVRADPG